MMVGLGLRIDLKSKKPAKCVCSNLSMGKKSSGGESVTNESLGRILLGVEEYVWG